MRALNLSVPAAVLAALLGATPALAANMTVGQAGAHESHTRDNRSLPKLDCAECHAPVCSPTAGKNVVFGARASQGGLQPSWNATTGTCSNVYCHKGAAQAPTWSWVDTSVVRPLATECALCHGYPPSSHDASSTACQGCHTKTVLADGTVDLAAGLHINGALDVDGGAGGSGCAGCHGYPPATGAHVAHFGATEIGTSGSYADLRVLQDFFPGATPTTAPAAYAFGCALCHPTDGALHRSGTVDVVLYEASAPAGSLKARALATATYDPASGTCSGTYCHSSGQATPAYVPSPGWFSGAHLGCAGCHANPPAYTSGGPGTATANSHLGLGDDGYEFGHFLGMPGPFHTSKHGGGYWGPGEDATAITCQTCHYDTTDPASTGPSGFYWLDTTGNYAVPGGVDPSWQASLQCTSCHNAAGAAPGIGKVLPLRHVNGTRDVVFDPRDALPDFSWLPAAPNRPTKPYWMTGTQPSLPWPASVTWAGTTVSFGLGRASYNPGTKTCADVACHMADTAPVWGRPYQYYTNNSATCYRCHPM